MIKPLVIVSLLVLAVSAAYADQAPAPPPYASPDRAHCEDELRKDLAWHDDLELQLYDNVHRTESEQFTTNNRHVVLAYAAIWLLTVGFVVFMWMRQGKLKREIARLSADLAKATKDEA